MRCSQLGKYTLQLIVDAAERRTPVYECRLHGRCLPTATAATTERQKEFVVCAACLDYTTTAVARTKVDPSKWIAELGIDQATWQSFKRRAGGPPSCYEKRGWWLRKFIVEFGPAAGDKLKDLLFSN